MNLRLAQLSPQAERWADFDCGDARITAKLVSEARRAEGELQTLYGAWIEEQLVGVMTLRVGHLRAALGALLNLGQGDADVPTAHLEVLAVRTGWQGQGIGTALVEHAILLSREVQGVMALRTLSLEAPPESWRFYERLGFILGEPMASDGTRPLWFDLRSKR